MPTRGRDAFRSVTLEVQEDFKVDTVRIWLHFITEDKFMPVSHNLWSVSVSSYLLRDILVLFICHAVTLNKILFPLFFICFTGYLHLQQRWEPSKLTMCLSTEDKANFFKIISAVLMQRMVIAGAAVKAEK